MNNLGSTLSRYLDPFYHSVVVAVPVAVPLVVIGVSPSSLIITFSGFLPRFSRPPVRRTSWYTYRISKRNIIAKAKKGKKSAARNDPTQRCNVGVLLLRCNSIVCQGTAFLCRLGKQDPSIEHESRLGILAAESLMSCGSL
jgi:hypothetical protein